MFCHVYVMILQKDNVANQREHLILLLANVHIRQFPKPDQQPKVRTFISIKFSSKNDKHISSHS